MGWLACSDPANDTRGDSSTPIAQGEDDAGGDPADRDAGTTRPTNHASTAADASSGFTETCNELTVEFEPEVPTVMLVVDRSGSMFDAAYGGFPTRWQALEDALFSPTEGVLPRYAERVRFGLLTYTADGQAAQCPLLASESPVLGDLQAAQALFEQQGTRPDFKAETPTGEAVRAATERLEAMDVDGPRHLLLVTDGNPDDCATPDPQCGQDASVHAVQQAYAAGIGTSVIGLSSDVATRHLQDLANAGAGLPVQPPEMQYIHACVNPGYASLSADYAEDGTAAGTAPLYQPAETRELAEGLETLIHGVSSCSFELEGRVAPGDAHLGTVELDGERLELDAPDGWSLRDPRTLELQGAACEQVMHDSERLHIRFPCEVVELI